MDYRIIGDTYVLRLDRGEEVLASLADFARAESIKLARVEGLGAADFVRVSQYDLEKRQLNTREFCEYVEISNLNGSISALDGNPFLHLHITLCDSKLHAYGGHLLECRISATAELFITVLDGAAGRKKTSLFGADIIVFEF